MNRDIAMLREVVVKLTQMLAGMGLKVTQQGSKAFVERDSLGKPLRVNIPQIPDNASHDLVTAIQGFVDHEVSRVLFDDYKVANSISADKKLSAIHNMVSDTFVEREMGKRFPGSVDNMKQLHQFFLEHITKKTLDTPDVKADPMKQFETLIMPMIRAWSGHERFAEFMEDNNLWNNPIVKEYADRVPDSIKKKLKSINSSEEALEIARQLKEVMEEDAMSSEGDDGEEGEGGAGKDKSKKDKKSKSKKNEKDKQDKSKNNESKNSSDDSDDENGGGSGDGENDEDDEDGDEESEGSGSGDGEDGEDGESSNGEGEGDGDGDESEKRKVMEHKEYKSSMIGGSRQPNLDASSFENAIAKHVSKEATEDMVNASYRVFTKDFDVIEPYKVDERRYNHEWLTVFDDEIRHMIGVMQKDIERMMAAQARTVSVPGYHSGKLCAPNLHRLMTGDSRIFKRMQNHKAKDTAVSLVIDNSGSMGGTKMRTAMHAAYALAMTLERVKIPCEAIGFTTFGYYDGKLDGGRISAKPGYSPSLIEAEVRRIRSAETGYRFNGFSRAEPLYMPIYKGWDERLTPSVKARFADAANTQRFLCQNIDGECVENAVFRLMRRPEKRHVCIVLSDGQPAGHPAISTDLTSHLRSVVKNAQKMGVEMVGIGIQSDAVSSYYPRNFVINNISQLPAAVMNELKRILIA